MEDLGSRQMQVHCQQRPGGQQNPMTLIRTNSVTQVAPYANQIQYTSPLEEVQRRVLNDFAAQIQSTFQQQPIQYEESNIWEGESVDSLEASNQFQYPQQPKITGPIVRPTPVVNIQTKKSNNSESQSKTQPVDQQELLRRSYHESFFVKNTPVTGDEQVSAWLDVNKLSSNQQINSIEKPPSYDGNDFESSAKRKSILKRSPSVDSNSTNPKSNTVQAKPLVPQARTVGDKARVKDSLEVINAKLLKELDTQVNESRMLILLS